MKLFNQFVKLNKALSELLTPARCDPLLLHRSFDRTVATIANDNASFIFLDIGAGRHCYYSQFVDKRHDHRFIGVDESLLEMAENKFLDEKIGTDACKDLGLPPNSVDVIVGRSVVEHLEDTEAFLHNAFRTLKPGGKMVLFFPGRYATFAMIKRMLPASVSAMLLAHLMPGSAGILGFKTHYNKTTYSKFTESLHGIGFRVESCDVHYFANSYFGFFVPVFLASFLIDYLRYWYNNKDLASYYLFVAVKPAAELAPAPSEALGAVAVA